MHPPLGMALRGVLGLGWGLGLQWETILSFRRLKPPFLGPPAVWYGCRADNDAMDFAAAPCTWWAEGQPRFVLGPSLRKHLFAQIPPFGLLWGQLWCQHRSLTSPFATFFVPVAHFNAFLALPNIVGTYTPLPKCPPPNASPRPEQGKPAGGEKHVCLKPRSLPRSVGCSLMLSLSWGLTLTLVTAHKHVSSVTVL